MNVKNWMPPYKPVTKTTYPTKEDTKIYTENIITKLKNYKVIVYCPNCEYSIETDIPAPMCGECNGKLIRAIFDDVARCDC